MTDRGSGPRQCREASAINRKHMICRNSDEISEIVNISACAGTRYSICKCYFYLYYPWRHHRRHFGRSQKRLQSRSDHLLPEELQKDKNTASRWHNCLGERQWLQSSCNQINVELLRQFI